MNERRDPRIATALRPLGIFFALLVAASFLIAARRACAAAARLEYARTHAAAECPDEATFRKEVSQRLGYDPFFPAADRMVSVEIDVVDGHTQARIVVVDDHGFERGSQTLDGSRGPIASTCTDLVRAAALAVSVVMDSLATKNAPVVEVEPPPPPPPPPSFHDDVAPVVTVSAPRNEAPRVTPSRTPTELTLAPQIWGGYGQWPLATFGVGGAIGVRRGRFAIAAEGRWDAPSTLTIGSSGDVQLQRATGSLVPCIDVSLVSFCAVGSFGATWASGETVANPQGASAFYAAFGGRVGLSFPLSRAVRVGVVADAEGIATPMHVIVGSQHFDSGPVAFSIGTNMSWSIF